MVKEIGTRVAVVSVNGKGFLGYGTYVGDFPRPDYYEDREMIRRVILEGEIKEFDPSYYFDNQVLEGKLTREEADAKLAVSQEKARSERSRPLEQKITDLIYFMSYNPLIELENGDYIWGVECWWGDAIAYDKSQDKKRLEAGIGLFDA